PAQITTHPGGGGANVAARLAALGVPTLLVARAGNDIAGRTAVAELRAEGVQTRVAIDPVRATGTVVVIVEPTGERTILPDRAGARRLDRRGRRVHGGLARGAAGRSRAGRGARRGERAGGGDVAGGGGSVAPLAGTGERQRRLVRRRVRAAAAALGPGVVTRG